MPKRGYLFINKTSTSSSLSNSRGSDEPITYHQLAKHAQSNAERKPSRKRKPAVSSTGTLVGWRIKFKLDPQIDKGKQRAQLRNTKIEPISGPRPLSPSRAIDSYNGVVVKIGPAEHDILQYCLKIWMPTSDRFPPENCQITAFTPFWPGDDKVAFEVIRGALQASDPVSLYALLAAASQRMQYISHVKFGDQGPQRFMFYAIRALRRRVTTEANPLTPRLLLDLSCFILFELHNGALERSPIFWKMMQDIIVRLGGLQNLDAFTALTTISCDYFAAVGTLEPCALDPFEKPELVGISCLEENYWMTNECERLVMTVLDQLDPRVRVFAVEAHANNNMLRQVQALGMCAPALTSAAVRREPMRLYMYPFIPTVDCSENQPMEGQFFCGEDDATISTNRERALAADTLAVLCRHKAVRTWAFFSMVTHARKQEAHLNDICTPPSSTLVQTPASILYDLSFIARNLGEIPLLLAGTGWAMRKDVMFWLSAIGLLVSAMHDEKASFTAIFRQLADDMGIQARDAMDETLAVQLPLEMIKDEASTILWSCIEHPGC